VTILLNYHCPDYSSAIPSVCRPKNRSIKAHLQSLHVQAADRLRERHFGEFDLTNHHNYKLVWAEDTKSTGYRPKGQNHSASDCSHHDKQILQYRSRQQEPRIIYSRVLRATYPKDVLLIYRKVNNADFVENFHVFARWRRNVALPFLFLFLRVFSVLSEKSFLPFCMGNSNKNSKILFSFSFSGFSQFSQRKVFSFLLHFASLGLRE
jgi:hypothetical protein